MSGWLWGYLDSGQNRHRCIGLIDLRIDKEVVLGKGQISVARRLIGGDDLEWIILAIRAGGMSVMIAAQPYRCLIERQIARGKDMFHRLSPNTQELYSVPAKISGSSARQSGTDAIWLANMPEPQR